MKIPSDRECNRVEAFDIEQVHAFESLSEALALANKTLSSLCLSRVIGNNVKSHVATLGHGPGRGHRHERRKVSVKRSRAGVSFSRRDSRSKTASTYCMCSAAWRRFPPLTFASRPALDVAVMDALRDRFIRYEVEAEHDYLFGVIGPHVALLALTSEKYLEQRRAAIAQQMRTQARSAPRIISGR